MGTHMIAKQFANLISLGTNLSFYLSGKPLTVLPLGSVNIVIKQPVLWKKITNALCMAVQESSRKFSVGIKGKLYQALAKY